MKNRKVNESHFGDFQEDSKRPKIVVSKERVGSMVISNSVFHNDLLSKLLENKLFTKKEIVSMCSSAIEALDKLDNILYLNCPICIVGDLHGQDEDLMTIFRLNGAPSYENPYLFLGDYINRGKNSLRVILFMICLTTQFPKHVFCLRGNHESLEIAKMYGFLKECTKKYGKKDGEDIFYSIMEVCNYLPLCAVINKKLFCVHGGISPNLKTIKDIEKIDRKKNLPTEGLLCDLMWSDPSKSSGFGMNKRGAGVYYGVDRTRKFLRRHKFEKIIRAHQVMKDGFGFCHKNQVLTIFSASNYVYKKENKGSVLLINQDGECSFLQYYAHYKNQKNGDGDIQVGQINQKNVRIKNMETLDRKNLSSEIIDGIPDNQEEARKLEKGGFFFFNSIPEEQVERYLEDELDEEQTEEARFNEFKRKTISQTNEEESKIKKKVDNLRRRVLISNSEKEKMKKGSKEMMPIQQYMNEFEKSIKQKLQINKDKQKNFEISKLKKEISSLRKKLERERRKNKENEGIIKKLKEEVKVYKLKLKDPSSTHQQPKRKRGKSSERKKGMYYQTVPKNFFKKRNSRPSNSDGKINEKRKTKKKSSPKTPQGAINLLKQSIESDYKGLQGGSNDQIEYWKKVLENRNKEFMKKKHATLHAFSKRRPPPPPGDNKQ